MLSDDLNRSIGQATTVALFVDGENLSGDHAETVLRVASDYGQLAVRRVYGDLGRIRKWEECLDLKPVHSGRGKNSADLLLSIDAMEVALRGTCSIFVIASSDRDFNHLAHRLRELGNTVIGIGEPKTPLELQRACNRFHLLYETIDRWIHDLIASEGENGASMAMARLGQRMPALHGVRIKENGHGTWRQYLVARPHLYDVEPKGTDAQVRLKAKNR